MYQRPDAPQTIGGVLDSGLRLFKASFSRTVGLAAFFALPLALPNLLNPAIGGGGFSPDAAATTPDLLPAGYFVAMIVGMFISLYGFLAVLARMHAVEVGQPSGFGVALRCALRRFPATLVFMLLYVVVILLGFAVFGGMFGLIVTQNLTLLILLSPLALGALILVFVLAIYWYFAPPLIVTQGMGPFRAMKRSLHLVRGNWWRSAIVITLATLIWSALGAIAGLLNAANMFSEAGRWMSGLAFIFDVLSQGFGALFMSAASLALLHDLTLRRGGADLAERIDTLQ